MSRQYCEHCAYPENTCVCAAIKPIILPIRVIILQHEKECNHAKNTARLAKLISPEIEIVNLSEPESLIEIRASIGNSEVVVLYPNDTSIALEDYMKQGAETITNNTTITKQITLILIDSSWRQAYGVWQEQTWLKVFTNCHFGEYSNRLYVIRKSKRNHQLSTIEALAYSVELICGISGQPYLKIFSYMQAHWIKYVEGH